MKELYTNLTQFEKKHSWTSRFRTLYMLYLNKLWHTLVKSKRTWIFNSLMLLPIIAGPIVAFSTRFISADDFYSLYSDIMFLGYFGIIIPLFTMYIASMMFNDEKSDRSITYLTSRPIHRFELVIVKYLSYLSIIPLFSIIATGLNYLSFAALSGFQHFDMMLWFLLAAFVSSAVYGAIFLFIGLLFKNPLWFGLFFVFIWEFVFASFSATLNKLTIAFYIKSLIVTDIYPNDDFRDSPAVFFNNQAHLFKFNNRPANVLTLIVVLAVVVVVSITLAWGLLQGDRFRVPYQAGRRPGGWKYYLKEVRSYLITFGILFISIGVVVGPINGLTKDIETYKNVSMNIRPDIYFWYDDNDPTPPSMEDMGFGEYISLTILKGDETTVEFSLDDVYFESTYDIHSVICDKATFDTFVEACQEIWLDYAEYYTLYGPFGYFESLLADYFNLANQFLDDSIEHDRISTNTQRSVNLEVDTTTTYYLVLLMTYFSTSSSTYFDARGNIVIVGEVMRIGGYAFGWTLVAFGITSGGFATYSIVTYKSSDEIIRYEEQIAQYQENDDSEQVIEEAKEDPEITSEH
ncbi:MAG: ABC transporter permease [Candidatus Heimdallarchaeota archaeon]